MSESELLGKFVIDRQLPSLNVVIDANRSSCHKGAKMKRDIDNSIGWFIVDAVGRKTLSPITVPCEVVVRYHEATMRRDADNIISANKFILDALQKQKILPNDNRRWVKQIHPIIVDDDRNFVEVFLIAAKQR